MKKYFNYLALICFLIFTNVLAQPKTSGSNFFTTDLKLNNYETVKLTDLKGKVVLLDFWYRGCLPCLKATPDLMKLQEEFKNDLVIIGINDRDDKEDVTDYYAYKKNTFYASTYKTSNHISNNLKITAFPTFIIINQKGEIVKTEVGFDKSSIRKTIKNLIKNYK